MRHHVTKRKLGRTRKLRTQLIRSLARSLILHEKINTTEARAKELRPFIERLVTKGAENTPTARRLISARLGGAQEETKKLCDSIAPRFLKRQGGYTRILKIHSGDGRALAQISFVA